MEHFLNRMLRWRASGIFCGVPSFCTANDLVIEAVLEQARRSDDDVLIEATTNQVNQYGGYTGMRPTDFRKRVYQIADHIGFPEEKIVLGGDHLGPLPWSSLPECEAMEKAKELVSEFVSAGYKKIHLDTSMRLADDPESRPLSEETIARRGAALYQSCEQAYQKLLKSNPEEVRPVYIIGSEVPIPGGAREQGASVSVTTPESVEKTLKAYRSVFSSLGLSDAFQHIIGIVVQPGVEFGDEGVIPYDREKAAALCYCMKRHPNLVMEGHSTDYQSAHHLREMVEDGVAILKIGPALTFALREGLFALSMMEKELIPTEQRARFIETLEKAMTESPEKWKSYYHGTSEEIALKRKYSFSDRSRYYLSREDIRRSVQTLFRNLDGIKIPLGMLKQFMPNQFIKVRDDILPLSSRELIKDSVASNVENYCYAVRRNYIVSEVFVN